MGSTGIPSYSTTPIENETVDGTYTWKEGQLPSTVNNSKRQNLTDIRNAFNDLAWFDYGTGTQDTSTHLGEDSVYASATSFTITGADVTLVYHPFRLIRATGSTTGTIYGAITSSSYNAGTTATTVNVSWNTDAGLQNESLTICIFQVPAMGGGPFEIIVENAAPSAGVVHDAYVAWPFAIYGHVIQANDSGDIVFDIWANVFATDDPPTVADTITASAKPELDGEQQVSSTTLTGWTRVFPANTALRINIDSISGIDRYTLTLLCRRV
jgi:hypothetical protein